MRGRGRDGPSGLRDDVLRTGERPYYVCAASKEAHAPCSCSSHCIRSLEMAALKSLSSGRVRLLPYRTPSLSPYVIASIPRRSRYRGHACAFRSGHTSNVHLHALLVLHRPCTTGDEPEVHVALSVRDTAVVWWISLATARSQNHIPLKARGATQDRTYHGSLYHLEMRIDSSSCSWNLTESSSQATYPPFSRTTSPSLLTAPPQ